MIWGTKLIAGAFLLATVNAFASTGDECELDDMMKSSRVSMDKMAVGIYETNVSTPTEKAIDSAPTVKDASCLPILDNLDTLMRMRIPSVGGAMSGIMTKIRDMACDMANDYLRTLVNRAQINISDPLGIASVGIGVDATGNGGVNVEQYDFGEVVKDAATEAAGGVLSGVRSETGKVINQLPNGPVNRTPRVDNVIRKEVNSAINGL